MLNTFRAVAAQFGSSMVACALVSGQLAGCAPSSSHAYEESGQSEEEVRATGDFLWAQQLIRERLQGGTPSDADLGRLYEYEQIVAEADPLLLQRVQERAADLAAELGVGLDEYAVNYLDAERFEDLEGIASAASEVSVSFGGESPELEEQWVIVALLAVGIIVTVGIYVHQQVTTPRPTYAHAVMAEVGRTPDNCAILQCQVDYLPTPPPIQSSDCRHAVDPGNGQPAHGTLVQGSCVKACSGRPSIPVGVETGLCPATPVRRAAAI